MGPMDINDLAKTLTDRQLTVATAESCTGGLIANTLTDISGSSSFFMGGIVAYSNKVKTAQIKVPAGLLKKLGAVSKPVAQAMAEGVRRQMKTDFGIATTGIAGPTGGTADKPVGLVYIAVASAKRTIVRKCFFTGTRLEVKQQACQTALGLLAKKVNVSRLFYP